MSYALLNQEQLELETISKEIEGKLLTLPHTIVKLSRGDIIFHQEDIVDKLGFVLEGVLKTCKYTHGGDEVNPHYFYKGEMFPEYLMLTRENKYIYTLVTEKNAKLLLVDTKHIYNLLAKDIKWNQLIINYMAWRGLTAEKWTLCNCYGTLKSRIAYMLLDIYGAQENKWLKIKDTQKIIATKLHVSRPMYNQELIKLEKEGLIARKNSEIKVINYKKLEMLI